MNMKQWLEDTIKTEHKKAMPVLSFPAVQKMGITVSELIRDSELQARALQLVAENTDALGAVSLMDLSVEAEAFGAEICISEDEVPTVAGALLSTEEEAKALRVPDLSAGRCRINIEGIEKACRRITDRPVFAGVIGPFSLAGRLLGVSETLIYCFEEEEMVHTVLEKAAEFLIRYCRAYKEAGANGVVMAEPLAGLLSAGFAEEFSAAYVRQIVEQVQDDSFAVIYHNCGNSALATIDSIIGTGCRIFHFGNVVDMEAVMEHIPGDMAAMGNIDPAEQFRNGTPETVYENTMEVLEKCGRFPNFILSSGCDIPPMSSWDNIDAFFRAAADYYKQ